MKILLIVQAVALLMYSLPMIFVPSTIMSIYGVTLSAGAGVMIQLFGGVATGNAVLSWLIRNANPSEMREKINLAFFIHWAVGFIVTLIGQLGGALNQFGWILVGTCFVLTIFFGYFRFVK